MAQVQSANPIVFRADGSSSIGMGHIMRCIALATEVGSRGVKPVFVTRAIDSGVKKVVNSSGFRLEEIPPDAGLDLDCTMTRQIAADHGAKTIFTDICHRQSQANPEGLKRYHESLASDFFTVAFGCEETLELPADVVVIPYVGISDADQPASDGQVVLLGPSYFPFRIEFIAASKAARTISHQGNRVLITVGGSDDQHLTSTALQAVCSLADPNLSLKVVLGAGFSGKLKREVEDIAQQGVGSLELLEHRADLAEVMLWADLAIIGDGLTKYEAAVTGTPSIMLCRPDRKVSINQEFAQLGSTVYLGYGRPLETALIAQQVERLLGDATLRNQMSQRGKALVDGRGIDRIIAQIPPEVLE